MGNQSVVAEPITVERQIDGAQGIVATSGKPKRIRYEDADLLGGRFGKLNILALNGYNKRGQLIASVQCDCEAKKDVLVTHLLAGQRSCGCSRGEAHGRCGTKEYRVWIDMKRRCEQPKNKRYADYGGRGITVRDRWQSFVQFYADMGPCPEGRSLDRRNNNGNYEPSNCHWATPFQQAINKRGHRNSTSHFKGVHLDKARGKWKAAICPNGKYIHVGYFESEIAAARAYDAAALRLFGPDAYLNFPTPQHGDLKKGVGNVGMHDMHESVMA